MTGTTLRTEHPVIGGGAYWAGRAAASPAPNGQAIFALPHFTFYPLKF